jgi:hypothetical protein
VLVDFSQPLLTVWKQPLLEGEKPICLGHICLSVLTRAVSGETRTLDELQRSWSLAKRLAVGETPGTFTALEVSIQDLALLQTLVLKQYKDPVVGIQASELLEAQTDSVA